MRVMHFRKPTKYDSAAYKTLWIFNHESYGDSVFVQLSINALEPEWHRMGDILEMAFEPYLTQEAFLDECLRLFEKKYDKSFLKITSMLNREQ